MVRRATLTSSIIACLVLLPGPALAAPGGAGGFVPGAAGIGDPYYPLDGNGGYDVQHYGLDLRYHPSTGVLAGVATISATATQNLSTFNLDLDGLTVRSIRVDGRPASWTRDGAELTVVPPRGLRKHHEFTTVVRYDGVPKPINDVFGISGFLRTDDGTLVAGEPHVAATWFPVNDHPSDKASYTFRVTVPAGLTVMANGVLRSTRTHGGLTTWTWDAREPMASYLATATIGQFDVTSYRRDGIRYVDAVDPDLLTPTAEPRTGQQYGISQSANSSFKRLSHTISVPAGGATLSFWVTRDTEPDWDFAFVEARTAGQDDWTTLEDLNGHTSHATGNSCPGWLGLHPFLAHYQSAAADGSCSPQGSTGAWWAATGASHGYEQWSVDLSAYAGKDAEISISYASDESVQASGLFVDDIEVSTGAGSTSFENDGNTLDGWSVPGPPAGSPGNANDWIAGTLQDAPPTLGEIARGSLNRQPEIIRFLSDQFGPYPFSAAGGIVDDDDRLGFALENQTRPIYSKFFFGDSVSGDSVVVHELAHQWFGDNLALQRWQHIWLNEGFATYAEWLWSEREGLGTPQEIFDSFAAIPADDGFWSLVIGDPGPDHLFDFPVYGRGAMTLQALRQTVGDPAFFRILRQWASSRAGGTVTTPEFIRLAERVSGQDLDGFFNTWLFTGTKPPGLGAPTAAARASAAPASSAAALMKRFAPGSRTG